MENFIDKQQEYNTVAQQLEILADIISGKQIEQAPDKAKEFNQMSSEVLKFLKHLV